VKSLVMGLPGDLVFRTKGQLAIDLLTEVFADGVRLDSPPPCCAAAPIPKRQRQPGQTPPADPGMIPLTVPQTGHLLTHPPPPGAAGHWLDWRRRHQARSAWHHQRTRLARDAQIALVSQ
jgi:hypothetical protein